MFAVETSYLVIVKNTIALKHTLNEKAKWWNQNYSSTVQAAEEINRSARN